MKKPATIAKWHLPNPALCNRIAAGSAIVVLLACTVLGLIMTPRQRTTTPAPITASTHEELMEPAAAPFVPVVSKSSVKNSPMLTKPAKPLSVEHLAVLPREFEVLPAPLVERVEPAFTPRTRINAIHKLPEVAAPASSRDARQGAENP